MSTYLLLCDNLVPKAFGLKIGKWWVLGTNAYIYRYLWMAINVTSFFLSYSTQWPSFCRGEKFDSGRIFLSSWGTIFAFSWGLHGCDMECIYDNWKVTTLKRKEDSPWACLIFKIFCIYKNNALLLRQGLKYEFYCTCFKGTVVIYVEWEGKKGGVKAIFDWPEGGGGRGGYLTFYKVVFRGGQ